MNKLPNDSQAAELAPASVPTGSNGTAMAFLAVMLGAAGLLIGGYAYYKTTYQSEAANGIYVVDGVRLTESYLMDARNAQAGGLKTPEQIDQETFAKEQAVQAAINRLAADGKVVIQTRNTLAYPPEADITAHIASELNIPLLPSSTAGSRGRQAVPQNLPEVPQQSDGLPSDSQLD